MTSDYLKASASIFTAFPAAPAQNGLHPQTINVSSLLNVLLLSIILNSIIFKMMLKDRDRVNIITDGPRIEIIPLTLVILKLLTNIDIIICDGYEGKR